MGGQRFEKRFEKPMQQACLCQRVSTCAAVSRSLLLLATQVECTPAQLLQRAVRQNLGVMVVSAGGVPVSAKSRPSCLSKHFTLVREVNLAHASSCMSEQAICRGTRVAVQACNIVRACFC